MRILREVLATLEERLRPVAGGEARTEAELMLSHLTGKRRLELYLDNAPVEEETLTPALETSLSMRLRGMPIQYAVGRAFFWDFELAVDTRVLIPRDDTELLVEIALRVMGRGCPLVIEVGVGSGAVSIALARESGAFVLGTELSPDARDMAEANAALLGLSDRIAVYEGDCLEPLSGMGVAGLASAVVCNPPYIRSDEMPLLPPETRWEPLLALDGGEDGLDLTKRVVAGAAEFLRPGGLLALEVGWDQARGVASLINRSHMYGVAEVHRDLSGMERVVSARRV